MFIDTNKKQQTTYFPISIGLFSHYGCFYCFYSRSMIICLGELGTKWETMEKML